MVEIASCLSKCTHTHTPLDAVELSLERGCILQPTLPSLVGRPQELTGGTSVEGTCAVAELRLLRSRCVFSIFSSFSSPIRTQRRMGWLSRRQEEAGSPSLRVCGEESRPRGRSTCSELPREQ